MSKVKASLSHLNALETIALGRNVVVKMTGNANFTTPVPALTALTTAINDLEGAHNGALASRPSSPSATARPVLGATMKPWPLKPAATQSPSAGVASSTPGG